MLATIVIATAALLVSLVGSIAVQPAADTGIAARLNGQTFARG